MGFPRVNVAAAEAPLLLGFELISGGGAEMGTGGKDPLEASCGLVRS